VAVDPFTACAQELAATPILVRQLLTDHTPTPHGWCQAHDGHAERHPCSIRRLAELAHATLLARDQAARRSVPQQPKAYVQ
jgi:hypothetical protein